MKTRSECVKRVCVRVWIGWRVCVYVRKIVWMSIEWEWLEDVYILYIPLESIKFNVFSLPRSSVFYEITRKCFTYTYHFCWVSLFPCSNSVSHVYALRALGISQFYFVVIVTSVLNVVVFLSEFLSHCRKEEFFSYFLTCSFNHSYSLPFLCS